MKNNIQHLSADLIDREKWNEWVSTSMNRRIYASSLFLDNFSPRWEALVMDEGKAFMPVTSNRKYWVKYVYQPLFVQQLGFFCRDDSYLSALPLFIEKLSSLYRFIDISLNEMNDMFISGYAVSPMNNYLLPMDKPYDLIYEDYSSNTRRNVRKAERLDLVLISGYKPSKIISLFADNNGKNLSNIRKLNYKRLHDLLEGGVADGLIITRAARAVNGDVIAAACFLRDYDRYVFYFSANTEEGKMQGAMFMLIDSFIKEYAGSGMLLDFNGSTKPGLARFYKGFGALRTCYQRLKINRLHFPLNVLK